MFVVPNVYTVKDIIMPCLTVYLKDVKAGRLDKHKAYNSMKQDIKEIFSSSDSNNDYQEAIKIITEQLDI